MKNLDLDSMTEDELRALNLEIVRHLQFYSALRRKSELMAFRVGGSVSFYTEYGAIKGTIVRINQKTASIDCDDGRSWRVAPSLLTKVSSQVSPGQGQRKSLAQGNLFQFPGPKSGPKAG